MVIIILWCLFFVVIAKVNKKAKKEDKPGLIDRITEEVFNLFY